jgi:UDP-GlcNAc:undecaprenyl-phosphate/decaprenyl-phosphate GlcNAc-1-phosphate transferase
MFYIDRYPALVRPLVIFLLAFFLSLHVTWLAIRLARRLGILDHPGPRKPQDRPVPCLGGVAVVIAVVVSLLLSYGRPTEVQTILYVGVGIAVVGLLDDIFGVRAAVKLLALGAACVILASYGIGLNRTPYPIVNCVLTFVWVAGVASAFNAIDNADGLTGTLCLISAVALFLLGWSTWQLAFSFLAMALAGGTLGFLHHNMKPARIYLGDAGSFFLGYTLSVLVIFGEWSESGTRAFVGGFLILAVPVYDLGLTTLLRIRHGIVRNPVEAIAHSDRDHLSHRLRRLGLTHGQMLGVMSLMNAVCCASAIVVVHAPAAPAALTVLAIALLLGAFGLYLDAKTSSRDLWTRDAEPCPGGVAG